MSWELKVIVFLLAIPVLALVGMLGGLIWPD